jgi:surface protein
MDYGLFGYVTGTIKNLTVQGTVTGGSYVGGIVADLYGTAENCSFTGAVNGKGVVGGIAGYALGATVRNCSVSGSVTGGSQSVGGIIGSMGNSTVEKCSANANVTGTLKNVGGICGDMSSGTISNCIHTGNVTGTVSVGDPDDYDSYVVTGNVGGIVGLSTGGHIRYCCHCGGDISGFGYLGGIIGRMDTFGSHGYNCVGCYYLSGTVSGGDVGLGINKSIFLNLTDNPEGYAQPLDETDFRNETKFNYWDFDYIWRMAEDHPVLRPDGVRISFDSNGGNGTTESKVIPGGKGAAPECGFEKPGYAFVCWNTEPDGTGTSYDQGETIYSSTPLTLYAMWYVRSNVSYVDENGTEKVALWCIKIDNTYNVLTEGTYYTEASLIIEKRLEIKGNVAIILTDGSYTTVQRGIHVPEGSSLTIYGQSAMYTDPATGARTRGTGKIDVQNRTVTAASSYTNSSAIGSDEGERSGPVSIYGGVIMATSGSGAAAIGGGFGGDAGQIELINCYVSAKGGTGITNNCEFASPAIGAGAPRYLGTTPGCKGVSIINSSVHAEAGSADEDGVKAEAIGRNKAEYHYANNRDIDIIYPVFHVQARDENGLPVKYESIPWHCMQQSVDLIPCTEHQASGESRYRCIYCGSTSETGAVFLTCYYNYPGCSEPFSVGVEKGTTVRITDNIAEREGYCFTGWNVREDGTGDAFWPGDEVTINSSWALYAQWAEAVTVDDPSKSGTDTVVCRVFSKDSKDLSDGWYYASGSFEVFAPLGVRVSGNVSLILDDEADITVRGPIIVPEGSTLVIYGGDDPYEVKSGVYTKGTGRLTVEGYQSSAGIGGEEGKAGGDIYINSGIITVDSYNVESFVYEQGGAAIGAGYNGTFGSVVINDGYVTATGHMGSAGIGGGVNGDGCDVVICGGYVVANGSMLYNKASAGIGAGAPASASSGLKSGRVMVLGGTVIAVSGTVTSEGTAAQAIGVNLDDAPADTGTLYLRSDMRAYNAGNAESPVSYASVPDAAKGTYVRFERCRYHTEDEGKCAYCGIDYVETQPVNELDLEGSGEEVDPFRIDDTEDWGELGRFIAAGGSTQGKYFRQTMGFSIYSSIGTADNPFQGTFDGSGNYALHPDHQNNEAACVPFAYIKDATIKNVYTFGNITANGQFASGLVSHAEGTCVIEHCRTSDVISSSVVGEGYHGGFIGECKDGSIITIKDCLFDGKITGSSTSSCGGFIGKAGSNSSVTIRHALMAAEEFSTSSSQNFVNTSTNTTLDLHNCYYLDITAQGSDQGQYAYVASGNQIKLYLYGDSDGFAWNTSLATILRDRIYAAAGETVTFTASTANMILYSAEADIARDNTVFTMTMPASGNVTIRKASEVSFLVNVATAEGGSVTSNFAYANPGQTVKISFDEYENYLYDPDSVSVTDLHGHIIPVTPLYESTEYTSYTFTMPADTVNVTGSFIKKYSFDSSTGTLTLVWGDFSTDDRFVNNYDVPNGSVMKVVAEPGVRFVGDCTALFASLPNMTDADLEEADTSLMTNAYEMFKGCSSLTKVSFSDWDVSSLTNISEMFYNCISLAHVDFQGWEQAEVTDMSSLLALCENLEYADLSSIGTAATVDMDSLFSGADNLSAVIMPGGKAVTEGMRLNKGGEGWMTSVDEAAVTGGAAYAALPATESGVKWQWRTDLLGQRYEFDSATGTLTLNWGDFNAENTWTVDKGDIKAVTAKKYVRFTGDCSNMFYLHYNLETVSLNDADTSQMTDISGMFSYCEKLNYLLIGEWDTSAVTSMAGAFYGCKTLKSIDLNTWDTSAVKDMSELFYDCEELESVTVGNWDTSNVTDMRSMFTLCIKLVSLDLSAWNTEKASNMSLMFAECWKIRNINLSGWDTSNVTNMNGMFSACGVLQRLDLSSFSLRSEMYSPREVEYIDPDDGQPGYMELLGVLDMFDESNALCHITLSPSMRISEDMKLNNGIANAGETEFAGWKAQNGAVTVSGTDENAVIAAPSDVTTYVWNGLTAHTVSVTEGITNGTVTPDVSTAYMNETVTLTVSPADGYELTVLTVKKGEIELKVTEGNNNTYTFTMPNGNVTVNATFAKAPQFKVQSIGLDGQIGVNFFVEIPDEIMSGTGAIGSYMDFSISGKNGKTGQEPIDKDFKSVSNEHQYYGFTFPVNSVQMADTITAVYHYRNAEGNDSTITKEYSVQQYLNNFTTLSEPQALVSLVKAINDYGYYAQRYLSANAVTRWTLGTDHEAMTNVYTTSYAYTKDNLEQYAIRRSLSSDIKGISYSLTLDTDTAINLFITLSDANYSGTLTATLSDGTPLEVTKTGTRYKLVIEGIPSHLLGKTFTVNIRTDNGISTVDVSVLSYAYAAFEDNAEATMAMSALYDYYLKSVAYIEYVESLNQNP